METQQEPIKHPPMGRHVNRKTSIAKWNEENAVWDRKRPAHAMSKTAVP